MVTVSLDALMVNAIDASLDDRLVKMGRQLCSLKEQPDSPDNRFAIEATEAAIRHTALAKIAIAAAYATPDYPADMTFERLGLCPACGSRSHTLCNRRWTGQ